MNDNQQQRLICDECGMAYDHDQERQHRAWHVDRYARRMELAAVTDAELIDGIHAMLDRLCANNAAALRIGAEVERG